MEEIVEIKNFSQSVSINFKLQIIDEINAKKCKSNTNFASYACFVSFKLTEKLKIKKLLFFNFEQIFQYFRHY